MINTCPACGEYRPDKLVEGGWATCPECTHRVRVRSLPLFVVGGASGTGKSTVLEHLLGTRDDVVLLDADILWEDRYAHDAAAWFERWLRLCKNIAQSGRSVVLFGGGFAVPDNVEPTVERRYLETVHYLALVAADDVLVQRISKRPPWRKPLEGLAAQLAYNRWLREHAASHDPPIALIDTTTASVGQVAARVEGWLDARL